MPKDIIDRRIAQRTRAERNKRLNKAGPAQRKPPIQALTVSVPEFAALVGVSAATAWRAVYSGEVKSAKLRHTRRVPRSEVTRFTGVEPPAAAE